MTQLPTYEANKDFSKKGDAIVGKGDANATFRGLQADLNNFSEKVGFPHVKVDGAIGPNTLAALSATYQAVTKANPGLAGSMIPPTSVDDMAKFAPMARQWLETTAHQALGLPPLRRYHFGAGQDWNVKDTIAYGAGPVHQDFVGLQQDLNRFAAVAGFAPLETDGFIGDKTSKAVHAVYQKLLAKNPGFAATPFPPPDTKEEAAEYAQFIRDWLQKVAAKHLLAEAGA